MLGKHFSTTPLRDVSFSVKVASMRFRDYFKELSPADKKALAERLGVKLGYLYRLKGGFSTPSLDLAARIQQATNDSVRLQDWQDEVLKSEAAA